MLLREATKYMNLLTMAFLWRFSCDGAARPSATPSRQRRAGVNEDTAETSVLRGLARLNRPNLADTNHIRFSLILDTLILLTFHIRSSYIR